MVKKLTVLMLSILSIVMKEVDFLSRMHSQRKTPSKLIDQLSSLTAVGFLLSSETSVADPKKSTPDSL